MRNLFHLNEIKFEIKIDDQIKEDSLLSRSSEIRISCHETSPHRLPFQIEPVYQKNVLN